MKRLVRGQSVVEMALILPFLVLIVLGTIELGYYVYSYSELENATRQASEHASKLPPFTVDSSDDNTTDLCALLIKEDAIDGVTLIHLKNENINISFPLGGQRKAGDQVQVNIVKTDAPWLSPLGRAMFGPFLKFNFTSRRTITDTSAPRGFKDNCEPE